MALSPSASQAVRDKIVADNLSAQTDVQIRDVLNAPDVLYPNPVPQGNVPKPMSVMALMGRLTAAEIQTVLNQPWIVDFRDGANAQDRQKVKNWANAAYTAGLVALASRDGVVAEVDALILDPNWKANLSWAEYTIGRNVTAEEVAAARP